MAIQPDLCRTWSETRTLFSYDAAHLIRHSSGQHYHRNAKLVLSRSKIARATLFSFLPKKRYQASVWRKNLLSAFILHTSGQLMVRQFELALSQSVLEIEQNDYPLLFLSENTKRLLKVLGISTKTGKYNVACELDHIEV